MAKLLDKYFTADQQQAMVDAIVAAEKNSSAEVRLHIDSVCKGNPYKRGVELFTKLKMDRTEQRNGVLLYIAMESRKVAIIGDEGINKAVEEGFWNSTIEVMVNDFGAGKIVEGISTALESVGERLKAYFPYQSDDVNELSDEISVGE